MNRIIQILINRDGMTYEEACSHFNYVQSLIQDAVANCNEGEIEDIMYEELGLEMDYIFDIM